MRILVLPFFLISFKLLASSVLSDNLLVLKNTYDLPGIASSFYRDGNIVEKASVGIRKVGYSEELADNDKYHLGSCGKSMTSTLAALVIEKGYLDWNSKLVDLLPNFNIHKKFQDVTFDMLLAHRSGLQRDTENFEEGWLYEILESGIYSPTQARELVTSKLLENAPEYEPGSKFSYSNIGYIIAGFILENLLGQSWESLITNMLFKPLKMNSCGFGPTSIASNINPIQPWGHKVLNSIQVAVHDDNPPAFGPAGTIHCSLDDWGKYLNMHIDGYNKRSNFLSKKSFEKLYTVYPAKNSEYTYGGWFKVYRSWANGYALTHNGTNTYNMALVWLAPAKEAAFLSVSNIMTNASAALNSSVVDMLNRNMPIHFEEIDSNIKTQKIRSILSKHLKNKLLYKYLFYRKVVIQSNVISHSHPITINTKHIDNENLVLSTFLHEQFHHYLDSRKTEYEQFVNWTRQRFKVVPVFPNGGARDELSTRTHILVNFLELKALSELIGKENAIREVQKFKHYKWIYQTVIDNYSEIESKVLEFKI